MKLNRILGMTALAAICAFPVADAAIVAYEGFDYTPGSDVDSSLNGGTGFSGAWVAGQQGGKIKVYDGSATDPALGSWDGVINNIPTSPAIGASYIQGSDGDSRITAKRTLSSSAGVLAGADNVLWASVAWRQNGTNFGRQVGFALGSNGLANRAANIDGSGDGIGVGGAANSGDVTPTIWSGGAIDVRTTTGATSVVSTSLEHLIVLKFTFADGVALDTVQAFAFDEDATLSELAFNAGAISASAAIDQTTLNVLSFSQSQVGTYEAIDEIRLGDTFNDVIGQAVPEPSSALLGAFGLLFLLRRRRA